MRKKIKEGEFTGNLPQWVIFKMSKSTTRDVLKQHKLAPHKRFGQNFLVNPNTAAAIAGCANITKEDTIIEVGVGLGALTTPLAHLAKRVIGIEIDRGLIRYHEEEKILAENVTLLHADILKVDFAELSIDYGGQLKIVANLPYSISNPFIFKLIDSRECIERAVVMLQKEVAERLMASPSTKEYGIPTVLLNGCASIQKLMTLKPHEFHPQPKIDSVVIGIHFSAHKNMHQDLPNYDFALFQKVVRSAFAKRRKTLINNLSYSTLLKTQKNTPLDRSSLLSAIEAAGLSPSIRAERLHFKDFIRLTVQIAKLMP